MSIVHSHIFVSHQLKKVVMPFPVCSWMLIEEIKSHYFHWVLFTGIVLRILPEAILTAEGRYATRSAYSSSSEDCDFLLSFQVFGSLFCATDDGFIFIDCWLSDSGPYFDILYTPNFLDEFRVELIDFFEILVAFYFSFLDIFLGLLVQREE